MIYNRTPEHMQEYTWFYSLKETPDATQKANLQAGLDQFLASWKSHGTPVDGLIRFVHDRFVIIQSNPHEARPSGCSIDSLKRSVGQILQQFGLEWMDAAYVFYRDPQGQIQKVHFSQIKPLVEAGTLTADTVIFDHSLDQSDDLEKWERPMADTWLRRYLPQQA